MESCGITKNVGLKSFLVESIRTPESVKGSMLELMGIFLFPS